MGPVRRVVELGLIGDLPAPGLPTAKPSRARWLPKHRYGTVSNRAHEIPLPTTEMPVLWNESDPLIEAAKLDAKPAFVTATHVRADAATGDFAPVRMRPLNSTNADVRTAPDETVLSKPVQVEL